MITAGIDIGIETIKVVVLNNCQIVSWHVLTGDDENAEISGEKALSQAAIKAGVNTTDIDSVFGTGIGGIRMLFVKEWVPEALCIAKGIYRLLPSTRTALDLGAGKSVAVRCEHGRPLKVARNDKCAAGTGKYLDVVAGILGISVAEMDDLSLNSQEHIEVQSTCTVFAESEVISLVHTGARLEDIVRGAMVGLAKRIYPLLLEAGMERDVALLGGGALNKGLVVALEEQVGHELIIPPEPRIVAALGAGLIAHERATS